MNPPDRAVLRRPRRGLPRLAPAGLLCLAGLLGACGTTERPNFVFFMTDDQRWDMMGVAGNPVLRTPHMDRLANDGARFRNMFVTTALCAPSRATILTGQWAHTHGYRTNERTQRLPDDAVIFPELLQQAGYESAFIGKSHFEPYSRMLRFDYYYGFRGQGSYFNPRMAENDTVGVPVEGHVTDIIGDRAVEYLNRPHDRPFMLFVWFKAPHRSWIPAERFNAVYEGQRMPRPPTWPADYTGKPDAFKNADMKIGDHADVTDIDDYLRRYYRTLLGVDENLGRILDAIDANGYRDNTVVIYTGDNGFFLGEWNFFDKRLMHEPSIRVPLLIRYPKLVRAGATPEQMVLNADLAPTILDLAGVPVPAQMQGRSLRPLLEGRDGAWRRDWLYEYYEFPGPHSVRKNRGVRTDRYKYIHYFDEPEEFELYDLQEDPDETRNLIDDPEHQEIRERLARRLVELRRELDDPDL